MKPVRLIFRNHLLPPVVVPFDSVQSYLREMGPEKIDTYKYAEPDEKRN